VNNFHLCHARTAFRDSAVPSEKRVLVRTWIDRIHSTPALAELSDNSTSECAGKFPLLGSAFERALAS